jgi:glyoxylase-like metal-dependent hydrolase (beta-lactamase superfamily II)
MRTTFERRRPRELRRRREGGRAAGQALGGGDAAESTYRDRRTITLGGRRVDLVHPGQMGHAPDFTVLQFPAERAVLVVDYVAVRTVPGSNTLQNGAPIAECVNAIKAVEVLDFDIVMTGHGPNGKKSDLADHRQYFEHLAERH